MSRIDMARLLDRWLEWHDGLEATGILRFCCAVGSEGQTVRWENGQATKTRLTTGEPIIGCLLIDATDLDTAAEIAGGCPGLEHGFAVDVFRTDDSPLPPDCGD